MDGQISSRPPDGPNVPRVLHRPIEIGRLADTVPLSPLALADRWPRPVSRPRPPGRLLPRAYSAHAALVSTARVRVFRAGAACPVPSRRHLHAHRRRRAPPHPLPPPTPPPVSASTLRAPFFLPTVAARVSARARILRRHRLLRPSRRCHVCARTSAPAATTYSLPCAVLSALLAAHAKPPLIPT